MPEVREKHVSVSPCGNPFQICQIRSVLEVRVRIFCIFRGSAGKRRRRKTGFYRARVGRRHSCAEAAGTDTETRLRKYAQKKRRRKRRLFSVPVFCAFPPFQPNTDGKLLHRAVPPSGTVPEEPVTYFLSGTSDPYIPYIPVSAA